MAAPVIERCGRPMEGMLYRVALSILLVGTLASACGDDGGSAPTATSRSPAPIAEQGLDGTYEITVEEADTSTEGGAESGRWTLTLRSGDAVLSGPPGYGVDLEPLRLTETRMVVPPDPTCPNNEPRPGRGFYEVELSGDILRFNEVRDPCGDRAFTLTEYPWNRVED